MLQQAIPTFLHHHGSHRTYWVAFSGGLDSHVLLDLCVKLQKQSAFPLRAIHIHHGLSPHADQWLAHCRQVCAHYSVDFFHEAINAQPPLGESLEDYARQGRYAKLKAALGPQDMLLTAHHQDDQAETLLLQLIRGAGPKGLSAMPALKPFGPGFHGRPLLAFTRAELQQYAETEKLTWINDELNADPQYSRNYLRHEILPLLKKRWPSVTAALARSAANCAETQGLLASYAQQDLATVQGSQPNTLSVQRLLAFEPARQRLLLRSWFEQQQAMLPSAVKLQQILKDVLLASWDSRPCLRWGKIELRRYQDDLYLLPLLAPHDKQRTYAWKLVDALSIPDLGELQAQTTTGMGLRQVATVEVRFRQGGEVYCLDQGNRHELKKFFQEQGIPPWQRDRLPLIYIKDELAAIPGHLVVPKFKAQQGEKGYELCFRGSSEGG